jgi:superfamily II DNA/RNA helicase
MQSRRFADKNRNNSQGKTKDSHPWRSKRKSNNNKNDDRPRNKYADENRKSSSKPRFKNEEGTSEQSNDGQKDFKKDFKKHDRNFGSRNAGSGRGRAQRRGRGRSGGGAQNHKKFIDESNFINEAAAPAEQVKYEPKHKFSDFDLAPQIQKNLQGIGYENPTAIQDQALQYVMDGYDLLGLANTGTGKTAAFLLPTINRLVETRAEKSVLIMAPTRELAQQIDEEFRKFSGRMNLYSAVVVGGANMNKQITAIKRNPHIIVGTPGRIGDLIKRHVLNLSNVNTFILDEVDRMLDMGFVHEMKHIASLIREERQTLAFSATMNSTVQELLNEFLVPGFKTVEVGTYQSNDHIDQNIIEAGDKDDKIEKLKVLLEGEDFDKVLIFGETKYGVQRLADHLTASNLPATAIHGNKSQGQRQKALNAFKDESVRILVATDVAARGLDIPNVSHVINFDTPNTLEDYLHRIGRTGRAGKPGKALTFVGHHKGGNGGGKNREYSKRRR